MKISNAERLHAKVLLAEAGLIGSDATTSFGYICKITPDDVTFDQFIADIKASNGDTVEDTYRLLAKRFGSDSVRAAAILRERA